MEGLLFAWLFPWSMSSSSHSASSCCEKIVLNCEFSNKSITSGHGLLGLLGLLGWLDLFDLMEPVLLFGTLGCSSWILVDFVCVLFEGASNQESPSSSLLSSSSSSSLLLPLLL